MLLENKHTNSFLDGRDLKYWGLFCLQEKGLSKTKEDIAATYLRLVLLKMLSRKEWENEGGYQLKYVIVSLFNRLKVKEKKHE